MRHYSPTGQDFYAAFGLGGSDKSIATVDADGVAFAAIQGLHEVVQEKDARIASLEKPLEALEEGGVAATVKTSRPESGNLILGGAVLLAALAISASILAAARR